jgi:hypothetical protein
MKSSAASLSQHTKELNALDPSHRIDLTLYQEESSDDHAAKIFDAIKGDLFIIRLKQIAWQGFIESKR